ncbi:hypothetical protein D9M68_576990 [compost metagenome]
MFRCQLNMKLPIFRLAFHLPGFLGSFVGNVNDYPSQRHFAAFFHHRSAECKPQVVMRQRDLERLIRFIKIVFLYGLCIRIYSVQCTT